jgi:ADP-ribose pyrophosphatase YjhB (NUDIX family)
MALPISGCFLLRVYALLFTDKNHIILSQETYQGKELIKFPGGGVEYGEGLREALSREIREELNLETAPEKWEHFYTTDFFQPSAFHERSQIISVYYMWPEKLNHPMWEKVPDSLASGSARKERFFLLPFPHLTPDILTLPIDRYVVGLLQKKRD